MNIHISELAAVQMLCILSVAKFVPFLQRTWLNEAKLLSWSHLFGCCMSFAVNVCTFSFVMRCMACHYYMHII